VFARRASASALPGQLIDGDVRDRAALARAAKGVEAICHAAALVSVWRPQPAEFDAVNVTGLEHALEVCRTQNIPRFVYTSSFLALPPAGRLAPLTANDYQRTKVAARDVARRAADRGLPVVSLFPGVVYGPGPITEGNLVGRMIRDHLSGRLPGIIGGRCVWSFAYIDDVADAHVAALAKGTPGGEYPVGGENLPQIAAFEFLRQWRGTPLPRHVPFPLARALGYVEEAKARLLGSAPRLTAGTVEILRHDWPLDSRQGRETLGFGQTSLEAGLKATLDGLNSPDLRP
jgi:farnesol dehydrogenase